MQNKISSIRDGQKFGDWTVVGATRVFAQKTERLCRCKCGVWRWVRDNGLKTGNSTNCGCNRKKSLVKRNRLRIGGIWVESKAAAHAWDRMIRRCYDPKTNGYKNYGGRGIVVCKRWMGKSGMFNFISDMGDPSPGLTLGRKNNSLGYTPNNCGWETNGEQQSNTRRNVYGFLNGVRMTAAQIGRSVGKHSSFIAKQIKKGLYANDSILS